MRKKKAPPDSVGPLFDWHIGKPRVTPADVVAIQCVFGYAALVAVTARVVYLLFF